MIPYFTESHSPVGYSNHTHGYWLVCGYCRAMNFQQQRKVEKRSTFRIIDFYIRRPRPLWAGPVLVRSEKTFQTDH